MSHFIDLIRWQAVQVPAFRGVLDFCSNMYYAKVDEFPTSEHAYQAAKVRNVDPSIYAKILAEPSPFKAKTLARQAKRDPSWENTKLDVMHEIVHKKFEQNADLQRRLIRTEDTELVEYNTWRDTYWGVFNGQGSNHLGRILMHLRKELLHGH